MFINFLKQTPARVFQCLVVAALFGFAPPFCDHFFMVEAQTTPTTVRVDVTPGHALNTIYPDTATGAWMDDLSKAQVDNLSRPEVIQGVKNLGWGSITMR